MGLALPVTVHSFFVEANRDLLQNKIVVEVDNLSLAEVVEATKVLSGIVWFGDARNFNVLSTNWLPMHSAKYTYYEIYGFFLSVHSFYLHY